MLGVGADHVPAPELSLDRCSEVAVPLEDGGIDELGAFGVGVGSLNDPVAATRTYPARCNSNSKHAYGPECSDCSDHASGLSCVVMSETTAQSFRDSSRH